MDRKRVIDESIHSDEMEGAYVSAEFRKDAVEPLSSHCGATVEPL